MPNQLWSERWEALLSRKKPKQQKKPNHTKKQKRWTILREKMDQWRMEGSCCRWRTRGKGHRGRQKERCLVIEEENMTKFLLIRNTAWNVKNQEKQAITSSRNYPLSKSRAVFWFQRFAVELRYSIICHMDFEITEFSFQCFQSRNTLLKK